MSRLALIAWALVLHAGVATGAEISWVQIQWCDKNIQ